MDTRNLPSRPRRVEKRGVLDSLPSSAVLVLLAVGTVVLSGCPSRDPESHADEIRVTSSSEVFRTAAKNLIEPCNHPAEFGRCGCYLDGFRTSCDLVSRCLELGFCEIAEDRPSGRRVTSESEVFKAAARSFLEPCNHPAEFGRCGCFLDGFQTSCDFVNRCLELGFCVAVTGG